jgi:molybdenum cofactor cytidylyltransferase
VIAALVLAAGRAMRMGSPKLLASLDGRPLLHWVIAAARAARCGEVVVVVGAQADDVAAVAAQADARTVLNARYREGMGTSLAAGIAALPADCDAAVVLLGDQPFVTPAIIDALIDAYHTTRRPLVASRYGGVRGAPTLLGRAMFDEAKQLGGDTGGRVLFQRHPDLVTEVDLGPGPAMEDVDTPDDLERVRRVWAERRGRDPAGQDP